MIEPTRPQLDAAARTLALLVAPVRHNFDTTGLVVDASFQLADKSARVDRIDINIRLAVDLPAVRRDALVAVARHCTVHNSITTPPDISIDLHTQ
jgi:putative redox protein